MNIFSPKLSTEIVDGFIGVSHLHSTGNYIISLNEHWQCDMEMLL